MWVQPPDTREVNTEMSRDASAQTQEPSMAEAPGKTVQQHEATQNPPTSLSIECVRWLVPSPSPPLCHRAGLPDPACEPSSQIQPSWMHSFVISQNGMEAATVSQARFTFWHATPQSFEKLEKSRGNLWIYLWRFLKSADSEKWTTKLWKSTNIYGNHKHWWVSTNISENLHFLKFTTICWNTSYETIADHDKFIKITRICINRREQMNLNRTYANESIKIYADLWEAAEITEIVINPWNMWKSEQNNANL